MELKKANLGPFLFELEFVGELDYSLCSIYPNLPVYFSSLMGNLKANIEIQSNREVESRKQREKLESERYCNQKRNIHMFLLYSLLHSKFF